MLLSIGVISARNPGGDAAQSLARAQRIAKGELLSPTVYTPVLIDGKGPLAAQRGVSGASAEETIAAVQMAKKDDPAWRHFRPAVGNA